jgi:Arc/MetJ family transcription regulator
MRTQIDVDDTELAEAMRTMGVTTKKDAVNKALHEWNQRVRRLAALESLAARGRRGEFDTAIAAHDAEKAAWE